MGSNNFTKTYSDGIVLTEAELTTAYQSLTPDLANTTQLTLGSTSGQFLQSPGAGSAAQWALPLDPLGPFAVRNYGLATSASGGALTVNLKTNSGATPSSGNPIDITFSNNGATSATYTNIQVTSALAFTITASATLGFGSSTTSTSRIHVYAMNNAGTPIMGVSARSDLDCGAQVTTVQMANTAKSGSILYATAALTVTPRLLGWVESARNSSGQWQTSTHVNLTNAAFGSSVVTSGTSANFSTGSGIYVDVKNPSTSAALSVTLTTTGRPVHIELVPDVNPIAASIFQAVDLRSVTSVSMDLQFLRGTVTLATTTIKQSSNITASSGLTITTLPVFTTTDFVPAGTYTYKLQTRCNSAQNAYVNYVKLMAYEIRC